ncbi:MAG: HAMP domain-containing histidine kinase [Bacteroidia bacterium]|nr:HAMP domain-containing histidine kinase [Bacteroidia bacterium]
MQSVWLFVFASLLVSVIYMISAYRKSMRQNKLILQQSNEIQKQNEELEHRNKLLQELNIEKQQIIGIVSHDLKGPFNRIFALIQLMSMSSENIGEDQKEYLGKIHQIVVDGLSMVRNLLDNRKLEDRGIDMHPEKLNFSAVLSSLIRQYQSLAVKKNIVIRYKPQPAIPIYADKLYLTRIFENLLSNAIKFSPPNKSVFVVVTTTVDEIEISIQDEGPGINAADQQKLFHKFERLTARPTAGESSTGLGLSIVKVLIDKMEGRIRYEGSGGKGANFVVNLKKQIS